MGNSQHHAQQLQPDEPSHTQRLRHDERFLDLCAGPNDEAAVRMALSEHPELLHCGDTRKARHGWTALHHASSKGRERVVRVLLEHDAELDVQDVDGRSPLHLASLYGREEVVRQLLEHGADVHVRDKDEWSALHSASRNSPETMVRMMCSMRADVDEQGVRARREEVVRLLLEHGAEVNAQDSRGATPLHVASKHGLEKVVRVLLEHGASVDARDKDGWTPLHGAARNGLVAVVRLLLEHGAELHAQERYGWTPLHLAVGKHRESVARVLLDHGADRNMSASNGETARDVARRVGKPNVVALLDTYVPVTLQMKQVLLALRGPTESPLSRFAAHSLFEPQVLSLIKCLLSSDANAAFEQLQRETTHT